MQGEQEGHNEDEYSARHISNSQIDENALQESRFVKSCFSMWRPLRPNVNGEGLETPNMF